MRYLLDTHTIIWAITDSGKLPQRVRKILEDPDNQVLVSPINFWEISLKCSLGKLTMEGVTPQELYQNCLLLGFETLALDPGVASSFHQLKASYHKDPFDRMLIWQAISEQIPLISKDPVIGLYHSEGLAIIWD